jgi:hypothetical protein
MTTYMVGNHIWHSYLLGTHKMRENYVTEIIYDLFINSFKEIVGMDHSMIAKKMVCF